MTNGTITTCTGDFYDSGGASGAYQNNENFTETFYPSTPGSMIRFAFTSFSTESGYDYLRIYDGINTSATLIGAYNGTTGPGAVTATNAAGALTFNFTSDVSVTPAGWSATISCYSVTDPTVAGFSATPLNPIVDQTVTFSDLSTNLPTSWAWSFSPSTVTYVGGTSSASQNPQVQFSAVGAYTVTLTATNAHGPDSEIKTNYINVTNCTVSTFPWNEGFENGGVIPGCWTQEQVSSSGIFWTFITGNGTGYPAAAHGGTLNACLKDATPADNKTKLITPALNLTSLPSPQLKFWHTQTYWSPDQDQLYVFYKTSLGGTWIQLATYTTSVTAWTQETIPLPAASGDYYIAFEGNAKYGRGVCVDDVQVSSSCDPILPVSVSITASANPVDQGVPVIFTAAPVNGGTTPAYQWKVNEINDGLNEATFTMTPVNGDVIRCVLTSNAGCITGNPAASNMVTMAVNSVPLIRNIGNIPVTGIQCFDAIQTIVVAGNESTFTVQNGESATMIAGENILYYPGSLVEPGGYLHGYISPGGPYCIVPPKTTTAEGNNQTGGNPDRAFFRVYPNPTDGKFTLEFPGDMPPENIRVVIYNMKGDVITSPETADAVKHEFSLSGMPAGIYLIRVISEKNSGTARIIRLK
jgi:PKD repeat protein